MKRAIKVTTALIVMAGAIGYGIWNVNPHYTAAEDALPKLVIPSVNMEAPVDICEKGKNTFEIPDEIACSYTNGNKILLMGHHGSVFTDLDGVKAEDMFTYLNNTYKVSKIEVLPVEEISMGPLMADTEKETVILMTCNGTPVGEHNATHRRIITAYKVEE